MKKKLLSVMLCVSMAATMMTGCGDKKSEKTAEPTQKEETKKEEKKEEKTETKTSEQPAATEEAKGQPEEKITLSIYAQYADDDTKVPYDYAVEQLKTKYPNVELNLIVQAQDDGQTLQTLAATGQLPDIFQANTSIINTLRETNQVMVLDEVAKSTGYLEKVYDSCQDLVYSDDGHIYCFPYAGQEYVLWYYNKAIFNQYQLEVPTTYDELKHCIQVFSEHEIVPMALFGQEGWITAAMYDSIATSYASGGIKALDEQQAKIGDDGYVQAANVLSELTKAGLFQKGVTITDYDQASQLFLTGQAAMFLNGQWYIEDATKALGENVDWMFYPAKDAATYEASKYAFSGGGSTSGYAVNPEGENAALAAEVAEFLAEKYCEAKVMYRHTPLVALNTGAVSEEALPAMMQKLSDTIPSMTSTTKFTWGLTNSIFNDGLMTETQGLVSGEYSAEEFIENMTDVMNRMNN